MKSILKIVLVITAVVLGFFVYRSINAPLEFKKEQQDRYVKAVDRLMKIRDAQIAYKETNKKYASTFDSLTSFIDTGKIFIVNRIDTLEKKINSRGVEEFVDKTIIDTIGFEPVKERIFGDEDYKNLAKIEFNGKLVPIQLKSKSIEVPDSLKDKYDPEQVFKASIKKADILNGLDDNYIKVAISEKGGIEGNAIFVGSLSENNTNGNWTKEFEVEVKKFRGEFEEVKTKRQKVSEAKKES